MRREPDSEAIRKEMEPGYAVHAERQTGKTTAILAEVHASYRGKAIIVAHSQMQAEHIHHCYRKAFPEDIQPSIVGPLFAMKNIRGNVLPVYVDEWWMLPDKIQDDLKDSKRVVGAVGTVMHISKVRL